LEQAVPGLNTDEVLVGIRPEHVRVRREGSEEDWPAQVNLVELHGGQAYLELDLQGLRLMAVESAEMGYHAGEAVRVVFLPGRLHFFHPHTAQRLEEHREGA